MLAHAKWEALINTLATVKFFAERNPDYCYLMGEVANFQQANEDALKYYARAIGLRPAFKKAFPQAYIVPAHEQVQEWKRRLQAMDDKDDKICIGLSWQGGLVSTRSIQRSIPLNAWQDIANLKGFRFINLQYGKCNEEIARFYRECGGEIVHWPQVMEDFDELAALIAALDLVISVQTTVVHLAGAIGARVWCLLPYSPEWRYGAEGDDMRWYQNVRLIRQQAPKSWRPVLELVTKDLISYRSNTACIPLAN